MAQTLGTEWGRELVHPQLWVMMAQRRWDAARAAGIDLVITDVRFENEVEWLRGAGGRLIYLARPDAEPVSAHASEQYSTATLADWLIYNDKTIDILLHRVDEAVTELFP
jgi:aromatic ring-cleaving dioxygenase